MQLRTSVITAALLLATSAAAAATTSPNTGANALLLTRNSPLVAAEELQVRAPIPGLKAVKGQLGTIAKSATTKIAGDAKLLRSINKAKTISPKQVKPVVKALGAHFQQTGNQISALAKTIAHNKAAKGPTTRDLIEVRDDLTLQNIIAALTNGLDALLPEVVTLIENLLSLIGLGGVNNIIEALLPGVQALEQGLTSLLTAAGEALAPLINPLLSVVEQILTLLFGEPTAVVQKRAPALSATLSSAQAASVKQISGVRSGLSENKKAVTKLLAQGKSVSPEAAKALVSKLVSNVQSATSAVNALGQTHAVARSIGGGDELERRLALPDLGTALSGLLSDLDALLPGVVTLLQNLLSTLGLGGINNLLDLLTPALSSLVDGLEQLLQGVASVLAPVVDPLLQALNEILAALFGTVAPA